MEKVRVARSLVRSLLEFSKDQHPNEMLVLLRGKKQRDALFVHQVVFAPFMISSPNSSAFNPYQVPADPSIVGTAHSHPSGFGRPSLQDLLHLYGSVMLIVSYPYSSSADVSAYDAEGRPLQLEVLEDE